CSRRILSPFHITMLFGISLLLINQLLFLGKRSTCTTKCVLSQIPSPIQSWSFAVNRLRLSRAFCTLLIITLHDWSAGRKEVVFGHLG
ncbi:hypothetical protein NDU88_006806, partial [Pleurodeles waltl]